MQERNHNCENCEKFQIPKFISNIIPKQFMRKGIHEKRFLNDTQGFHAQCLKIFYTCWWSFEDSGEPAITSDPIKAASSDAEIVENTILSEINTRKVRAAMSSSSVLKNLFQFLYVRAGSMNLLMLPIPIPIQEIIIQDDFNHVTLAIDDGQESSHKLVFGMWQKFYDKKTPK